ncbi:rho GDP-dissociation inhibitor 1-like [Wolffia australiana]
MEEIEEVEERAEAPPPKSGSDGCVNNGGLLDEEDDDDDDGDEADQEKGKISEEEDDSDPGEKLNLGPQFTLKQQFEKDKEDESLRKWKEQLLGNVDLDSIGEHLEPEVKIESLSIISPGRPDLVLSPSLAQNSKTPWFTLKEGSQYKLKFAFSVRNNIVAGLTYSNTVWKAGLRVDSMKEMFGTFSPRVEPYECEMQEERTPSGIFARGSYSARSRFIDDDGKCHVEINYSFDIKKEWALTTSSQVI